MVEYNSEFACWLRMCMTEMDKASNVLAEETKVTPNTVSNWRRGKEKPARWNVKLLAKALGVKEETITRKLSKI